MDSKSKLKTLENKRRDRIAELYEEKIKTRAHDSDVLRRRFGLGEIRDHIEELENLTEKDVAGLAKRIKRRKHADLEDLHKLKYAFLQSMENIREFSKIQGALQVIIKELTGMDSERQVSAAECLCNLSLGEAPVCEKIASMAGSYLVTYMESGEEKLQRTSLWILANILATGGKGAQIMLQMKLVLSLWKIYVSDNKAESAGDAAICLQLISESFIDHVSTEEITFIRSNMHLKNPTLAGSEYHLQIIFNFNIVNPETPLDQAQILYLINCSLGNLYNAATDINSNENRLRILYSLRVLANLLAVNSIAYDILLQQITSVWHSDLLSLFNKLFAFNSIHLSRETLWLLGNIMEKETQNPFMSQSSFLDKLQIPPHLREK